MTDADDAVADDLVSQLGAVCAESALVEATAATEAAIRSATVELAECLKQPGSPEAKARSLEAIRRASDLVHSLGSEVARSKRIMSVAAGLSLGSVARREREGR